MQSPVEFLNFFLYPKVLIMELDKNHNVEQGMWFEPSMSGAYIGYWTDDHIRGRRLASFFFRVVTTAFDSTKVMLSTIKDRDKVDKFLEMHGKLGFVILGRIPHVFDGCPAWVLYLDRGSFLKSNARLLDAFGITPAWEAEED
jgi:hypothetical protein